MGKFLKVFNNEKESKSFYDKYERDIKKGLEGEEDIRKLLITKGIKFIQADLIFESEGQWFCAEVKTQEKATPEKYRGLPFEGHGLPPKQIEDRLDLYNKTGFIPYFFVRCLTDNVVYHGDLRELMETDYYEFHRTPRIVFNINHFKKDNLAIF